MFSEDEYLMLSGIQHFVFCQRQWALIHIENQWEENYKTADGQIMHAQVHNAFFHEKRGNTVTARAMAVSSSQLGLSGECDAVEFTKSDKGVFISSLGAKYTVTPVEYKRGKPKSNMCDMMQLAAQAMCLEEMLCCEIEAGYLYYGETHHRQKVPIDSALRESTVTAVQKMHDLFRRGHTPKVRRTKSCNACSLKEICLPMLDPQKSAFKYINDTLQMDE